MAPRKDKVAWHMVAMLVLWVWYIHGGTYVCIYHTAVVLLL